MFIWRADVMERAFLEHAEDIHRLIGLVAEAKSVQTALKKVYTGVRAISVDFAVMEKVRDILVVRADFAWDDVGSWTGLGNQFPADKNGNITVGKSALLEAKDSVVVSENDHLIAAIGVKDLVIVHTQKATLVCPKDRVQDIKRLLKGIK